MAIIRGTSGNNRLIGTNLADLIDGLAGNDTLLGNGGSDRLVGGKGKDTLDGGLGADRMEGGTGNDIYIVNAAGDKTIEASGGGYDHVKSSVTRSLSANIEKLSLTGNAAINGTGNALNNAIIGNNNRNVLNGAAGNDALEGQGGNDTLNGGGGNDTLNGGAGTDSMTGGTGNDSYGVDSAQDIVNELAGGGTDTIRSAIDYSLALLPEIENLTLTGAAIAGTGNALDNVMVGNGRDNILDGGGGADAMAGGGGNDTYEVDDAGDTATEGGSAGIDLVRSSVNFTLSANVENLVLLDGAITGTGNELANIITGNGAVNVLSGGDGDDTLEGGEGGDDLIGGLGDDTYDIDSNDTITELADEGTDTIRVESTYSLAALDNVENLTLEGNFPSDGTGNGLSNVITGTELDNVLDGAGGSDTLIGGDGNDTLNGGFDPLTGVADADAMSGGRGDDLYFVDHDQDVVSEDRGGGIDTVQSAIDFDLGEDGDGDPNNDLENLILNGSIGSSATGNSLNNLIQGDNSDNSIEGRGGGDTLTGGGGGDTLTGGGGADTFVYTDIAHSTLAASDLIEDFGPGEDIIDLTAIDANNVPADDDQAFEFGGAGATPIANSITYFDDGEVTFIQGDVTGDNVADFQITLVGVFALDATDFAL